MIVLFEPTPPEGTGCSGGYLYNAAIGRHLAETGAGRLVSVLPGDLLEAVGELAQDDVAVIDGLFGAGAVPALASVRGRGRLLLHWLAHRDPRLDAGVRDRAAKTLERCVSAADAVIVTAESTAEFIRARLDPAPVRVVTPGVHRAFRRAAWTPAPRPPATIVVVGSVTPPKAPHRIVEAAADLPGPVEVVLVGDDTTAPEYARHVRERSPTVSVRMTGALSIDDAAAELRRAHVYASSSILESYGMANAEALAVGLPCVLSRTGDVALAASELGPDAVVEVVDVSAPTRVWTEALARALESDAHPHRETARTWAEAAAAFTSATGP